jgi:hypothetical protein
LAIFEGLFKSGTEKSDLGNTSLRLTVRTLG